MSHVFREIGKVFAQVWDFVRPIVEVVAIAAAVYFSVGLALSYMPATSAFAAAMPGFASTGGVAGGGVFSSLASSLGMGGGLASGAAESAAAAAVPALTDSGLSIAATTAGADLPAAAVGGNAASGAAAAGGAIANTTPLAAYVPSAAAETAAGNIAAVNAATAGYTAAAGSEAAASALTNKLLLASVGTQLISGLTAPSPTDIASAKAGFYGSFYGKDASGSGPAAPDLSVAPQAEPQRTATVGASQLIPGINIPAVQASTPAPGAPGFQGVQKAQLIPSVPSGVTPVLGDAATNAVAGITPLAQPKLITTPTSTPPVQPA
jgi:trimeric autotransporter adhesin